MRRCNMIRVTDISNTDSNENSYRVSLFADTREEVVPGAKIIGLPEGATIEAGSDVFTSDAQMAFMKSNGQWNWGDE